MAEDAYLFESSLAGSGERRRIPRTDDEPQMTLAELRAECRRLLAENDDAQGRLATLRADGEEFFRQALDVVGKPMRFDR